MTIKEVFKKAMKSHGYTYKSLAECCGMTTSSASDRVNRGSMSVDNLIQMMDAMGYEVIIKDRRTAASPMKLNGISEEE